LKTFQIFVGFEQLPSSSGWRVMARSVVASVVASTGITGLNSSIYFAILKFGMS